MAAPGRIAVLGGGHASEHEISLLSAAALTRGGLEAGFEVIPVVIAVDGTWHALAQVAPGGDAHLPERVDAGYPEAVMSGDALEACSYLKAEGVQATVLGVHGRGGEDGSLQGFFEWARMPYTGCGVQASAFAADKARFKLLLSACGIPTPEAVEVSSQEWQGPEEDRADILEEILDTLRLPVVVKPSNLGSSVATFLIEDEGALAPAIDQATGSDRNVLVEEYVAGREFTGSVLGSAATPESFPIIEIVPRKASWFDAASKYEPGGADEIVPADISTEVENRLRRLAAEVHTLIEADGTTRTDFMMDASGKIWVLETNTLPGMTEASLYPKALAAAGWGLADLVQRQVEDAARRQWPWA